MEQAHDRRQRKTRDAIKNAVIDLLGDRDISKISATDIAARADINRSTFYMHYADAYDVIKSIQDDVAEMIIEIADVVNIANIKTNLRTLFRTVTERIDGNPGFKKFLEENYTGFYARIEYRLIDRLGEEYAKAKNIGKSEAENYMAFVVCGLFGAYSRWMKERGTTLDEFCDSMLTAIDSGLLR